MNRPSRTVRIATIAGAALLLGGYVVYQNIETRPTTMTFTKSTAVMLPKEKPVAKPPAGASGK